MSKLILSIVVPTKNRYYTLKYLVNGLSNWKSREFELIIQDNSDDNSDILEFLNEFVADERIKYHYHKGELNAIENCNKAVLKARGEYVTFIGDDDFILEKSIEFCNEMSNHNVDALICNCAGYSWPDLEHKYDVNKLYNGLLICNSEFNSNLENVFPDDEYEKVLKSGATKMHSLPRVYQSFVSKAILDQLYSEFSTFFPGPVPDMANAVALTAYVKKCKYVDYPLIISGQSALSMSGKNSVRKHQGLIKKEKSIPADAESTWDNRNPKFWSAPTIWAEAFIKASERIGKAKDIERFNFSILYAYCFSFVSSKYYKEIFRTMLNNRNNLNIILLFIKVGFWILYIFFKRVKGYVRKRIYGIKGVYYLDIIEASYSIIK